MPGPLGRRASVPGIGFCFGIGRSIASFNRRRFSIASAAWVGLAGRLRKAAQATARIVAAIGISHQARFDTPQDYVKASKGRKAKPPGLTVQVHLPLADLHPLSRRFRHSQLIASASARHQIGHSCPCYLWINLGSNCEYGQRACGHAVHRAVDEPEDGSHKSEIP